MTTKTNEKTIAQLVEDIYDDNLIHFDDRDTSDDCDCQIHSTLNTIIKYWGE